MAAWNGSLIIAIIEKSFSIREKNIIYTWKKAVVCESEDDMYMYDFSVSIAVAFALAGSSIYSHHELGFLRMVFNERNACLHS